MAAQSPVLFLGTWQRVTGAVLLLLGLVGPVSPLAAADFAVSALARFTYSTDTGDAYDMNRMNRGDNPFSTYQFMLLSEAKLDAHTSLFLEIPFDSDIINNTFVTFWRPFIRMTHLAGQEWLNVQVGRLPTLFGVYGERYASNEAGLIGSPLLFYYHTAARADYLPSGPDYYFQPGVRGQGYKPVFYQGGSSFASMPIIYNSCWDSGAELFGTQGGLQYSAAVTMGTVSRPARTNYNDGYQVLGRLGYEVQDGPLFGLRAGATASAGPYLDAAVAQSPDFPAGATVEDYLNTALGVDLTYANGPWQFFAEGGHVGYEMPNVDPTLTVSSYFVEAVRDLGPMFSVAARQEGAFFNTITSTEGLTETWDYDLWRWEAAVNFRFRRNARLRVAYQDTRFPDAPELDGTLFAVQLHLWTR